MPVDPLRVDRFDPESVPSVGQLLRELNELEANAGADSVQPSHSGKTDCCPFLRNQANIKADWERTSLKPYVDMLDDHVRGLMDEVRRIKREEEGMHITILRLSGFSLIPDR